MSSVLRPLALLAALLPVACTAAEPPPKLTPGSSITITFDDMPPTFFDLQQHRSDKAQMTVFVPTNYDPDRRHPLLLLLYGGDGGNGGNCTVARALAEDRDFVCAAVPLFKATDPTGPGGEMIMRDPDAKYMWPFFRTMLDRLDQVVPNLDPAHRVLGGFSNGAHATQGLLDQSDGEVARRFSAIVFVEGGGRLQHYELLRDKPFLMVSSQARSRPRAQQICDAATAAGARTTFIFEDIGTHGFPVSSYPAVRQWLRGPALE